MPLHPAWVKNIARRVLWGALEADISKKDRHAMAQFFEGRCAYCESELPAKWHADHLLSVDSGGFNHLSNRVPACPRCNEHEKRDMDWASFLTTKVGNDSGAVARRRERIEGWMQLHKPASFPVTPEERETWKREVERLSAAIDEAWKRLRDLKKP